MKPLSPVMIKFLQERPSLSSLGTVSIQQSREERYKIVKARNEAAPTYDLVIQDLVAPSSYGPIPLRRYLPPNHERCPTLLYFHGGGFTFGGLDSSEVHCRELAHFAQTKVISADYPLAPEHTFPAAPEACYEVTSWVARCMGEWKWDLDRLYIGGASAGATLSAVVAQMIRDRGGPKLRGQILICPSTDSNFDTPSYLENATGTNLTREKCMLFVSMYCPDSTQDHNPLACPLHAKSFANLPPAMVVTAECDPLRDDGRAYARKLQEAHIPCDDLCYEGMMHCFSTFPIDFPEKWDVINKIRDFVHKEFSGIRKTV